MHQETLIPTLNPISPDDHAPTTTSPPTLPVELYLEVISQIPRIPVSCHTAQDMNPKHPGLYRRFTLSALSQTCRTLRRMVLPYLWETIEVLDGMELGNGRRLPTTKKRKAKMVREKKNDAFAKELLRQLNVVTIQSPPLAQHVLNMNIRLVHHPTSDIYDDIYSCMKLLPNLTTVRLLTDNPLPQSDTGRRADALPQFPQIRIVYLSDTAWRFFPQMCPNLIHISSSSVSNVFDAPLNTAQGLCFTSRGAKTIKVIGRNPFRLDLYKELQAFANLRDLTLEADLLGDLIVMRNVDISKTNKRLHTIRVRADVIPWRYFVFAAQKRVKMDEDGPGPIEEEWALWCQVMLQRIQNLDGEQKKLYFTSVNGEQKLYVLNPGSVDAHVIQM